LAVTGGSTSNLNALGDELAALQEETRNFTGRTTDELERLHHVQQTLPTTLSQSLTNDFKLSLAEIRSDHADMQRDLGEIRNRQQHFATRKDVRTVRDRLEALIGDSTLTIPEIVESIELEKTTGATQVAEISEANGRSFATHMGLIEQLQRAVRLLTGGTDSSLSEAIGSIARLSTGLDDIISRVDSNASNFATELTELRSKQAKDLTEQAEQLTEYKLRVEREFGATNASIADASRTQKEQLTESLAALKTEIEQRSTPRLKALSTSLTDLTQQMEAGQTRLSGDITNLENQIAELQAKSTGNYRDVNALITHLGQSLNTKSATDDEKLASQKQELLNEIKTNAGQLQHAFNRNLSDRVDDVNQRLVRLRSEFDDFRAGTTITLPALLDQNALFTRQVTASLQDSERNAQAQSEEYSAKLAGLAGKLKERKKKLTALINNANERITTERKWTEDHLRENYSRTLKDFKETEARINQELAGHVGRLTARNEQMVETQRDALAGTAEQMAGLAAELGDLKARSKEIQERQKTEFEGFLTNTEEVVKRHLVQQNGLFGDFQGRIRKDVDQAVAQFKQLTEVLSNNLSDVRSIALRATAEAKVIAGDAAGEHMRQIGVITAELENSKINTRKVLDGFRREFDELKQTESLFEQHQTDRSGRTDLALQELTDSLAAQLATFRTRVDGELEQNLFKLSEMAESHEEAVVELREELSKSTKAAVAELTQSFGRYCDDLRGEMVSFESEQTAQTQELKSSVATIENTLRDSFGPKLRRLDQEIKRVEVDSGTQLQKLDDHINLISEKGKELNRVATEVESKQGSIEQRIQGFATGFQGEHLALAGTVESMKNDIGADIRETRIEVEAITKEMASLKHIHHLNADFERFEHRFEEAMMHVQQFQKTIFNFVVPGTREVPSVNQKSVAGDQRSVRNSKKLGPSSQATPFAIDPTVLSPDVDLGPILRMAFLTHSSVSLDIPRGLTVKWNSSVSLLPNQTLVVSGHSHCQIVMEGFSLLGSVSDASRVILDGFCSCRFVNLKIQARCASDAPHPSLDLCGLIVTRCWDAAGMSTVLMEGCEFEVDIPIVNIGANAVSNVNFVSSRVQSISRGKSVVYPVSAECGGYGKGHAAITTRDVRIGKPRVDWLQSPYLSQPELPE
jgi:hypothetical protein